MYGNFVFCFLGKGTPGIIPSSGWLNQGSFSGIMGGKCGLFGEAACGWSREVLCGDGSVGMYISSIV